MPAAPLPLNEAARLAALRRYGILDSESSPAFDALTRLAARLFDVPVAVVSLVDEDRQWFKARVGIDACQTPRDHAFCAWALLEPDILEVLDPLGDPRFADNPLVTGDMRVRYYAGAPLINPDGLVMGTLCLFDTKLRPALGEQQRETLRTLADAVMGELNLHASRLQSDLALSAARDLNTLARERLSGLAESFNTPLTALLGYGQLLYSATHTGSSDPKLETLGRYADAIQSAGKSLLELVNTTLEAMRAHHGSIDQNNAGSVANLQSLLDEVHTLTAPLAEQRGMTMRLSLTSPLWVKGDPIRLKQMVLALVANALKHAGRGVIDLNAHPSDDGRSATLTVSDQGPGLPPAMASLLDPAPLTDPALLAHRGGLTVVRTMAAMQGFGLAVTSTPGIGCMVQISARRHQPELVSA